MFTITPFAEEKIRWYQSQTPQSEYVFLEKNGSCCQSGYMMDFQESPQSDQEIIEIHGISFLIPSSQKEELETVHIDYLITQEGEGFKITAQKQGCGCKTG